MINPAMSATAPLPAKLLTTDELAQVLDVTTQHIRNMQCQGKLEPVRVGAAVRWDYASVREQLRNRKGK